MKAAAALMMLLTVGVSGLVLWFRPTESPTEAELIARSFPDGPHWIIRALELMGPLGLCVLAACVAFSIFLSVLGRRLPKVDLPTARAPLLLALCLLPCWIGIAYTFSALRLAPYYAGHGSYLLGPLGEIRLILFTSLVSALLPAAIILLANRRVGNRV